MRTHSQKLHVWGGHAKSGHAKGKYARVGPVWESTSVASTPGQFSVSPNHQYVSHFSPSPLISSFKDEIFAS